jgi:hypothetical protein
MSIIKLIYITIFTILISSIDCYAQKPRKIFSHIQENNLNLALEEYAKIKSDKVYDTDEKILFEIADCIFLINKSYPKYNPILSIKYFNNIYNNLDNYFNTPKSKKEIHKFLAKYDLTFDTIANRIHSEIAFEAKKINTVESYDKALEVCSDKFRFELKQLKEEAFYKQTINERTIGAYKTFILTYSNSKHVSEIQVLLERKVLDNAKSNQSVDDLNTFIVEYATSNLKQEATDFRDSIVLSKVPNTYDAMLAFTKEYTNSIYTNNVKLKLGDLLFERIEKNNEIIDCQLFMKEYANHVMYNEIKNKLHTMDSLIYKDAIDSNTYFTLKNYLDKFPNGVYRDTITNVLNFNFKLFNDVYLTNGMKIIHDYINVDSTELYDVIEVDTITEGGKIFKFKRFLKFNDQQIDCDKDSIKDIFLCAEKNDIMYVLCFLSKSKKILIRRDDFGIGLPIIYEDGEAKFILHNSHNQYLYCDSEINCKFNSDINDFELVSFNYGFSSEGNNFSFNIDLLSKMVTKKDNNNIETFFKLNTNLQSSILFNDDFNIIMKDIESLLNQDNLPF